MVVGKLESNVKRCIFYSGRDMKLVIYIYKILYILYLCFLMILIKIEILIIVIIFLKVRLIDKIRYVFFDVF